MIRRFVRRDNEGEEKKGGRGGEVIIHLTGGYMVAWDKCY